MNENASIPANPLSEGKIDPRTVVDLSKFSTEELFRLFQLLLAPPMATAELTAQGLDNWRASMVGLIDTLVQRYKELLVQPTGV